MTPSLTVFTGASTEPEFDRPRPDRLMTGNPLRTTWNHYDHAGVSAGTWACETGAWRIAFAEGKDEFFHVIEGRIRITDDAGMAREFGPGDACVIPGGFTGLFEVIEPVRKHYVIADRV
ncbi:MAG TPA: cupin domain-containing protein [Aromatoleum sp.]|uniref:cupin domain-containing protein n=1 Tax=Aromatoleum sp. TaxID=2307007 RepID=UPI002B45F4F4|nr:cupin domain-containing protein [Aromatoleum sp.]HJV27429.1 cupin domain-containing protein [Aromatoleum sp.]